MATFSSQEAELCYILDCTATLAYTEESRTEPSKLAYKGLDVQVMDQQGNIYDVSLDASEISEAKFGGEDSMKEIIMAVCKKLTGKINKEKDGSKKRNHDIKIPIQGIIGRKLDEDFR